MNYFLPIFPPLKPVPAMPVNGGPVQPFDELMKPPSEAKLEIYQKLQQMVSASNDNRSFFKDLLGALNAAISILGETGHRTSRGFTIAEMMIVLAIVATLASMSVPAFNALAKGSELNQAAQELDGILALGRQVALTKNEMVEVRLFRFSDPDQPGEKEGDITKGKFRAVQIFEARLPQPGDIVNGAEVTTATTDTTQPVYLPASKAIRLPPRIEMDSGAALSPLLNQSQRPLVTASSSDPMLLNVGTSYEYAYFRFNPDGSTDLTPQTDSWFVTLHDLISGDGLSTPPPDYSTIQIDAYNGHIKIFHP